MNELRGIKQFYGQKIKHTKLEDDRLVLTFDGAVVLISDDGQDCCEKRYMTCDDDLSSFKGAELVSAEIVDGPLRDRDDDCHDIQFLNVQTSKGLIQCCSHNEHNGYYGGFSVRVTVRKLSEGV